MSVYEKLEYQVNYINSFREEQDKYKVPHYSTLINKINLINKYVITRERYGKKAADKDFMSVQAGSGQYASRPLEIVFIDNTPLDLFVVDENDRKPIGRPTLTFAIDMATHYPLGFYVGYVPASYFTASECLYHSIIPKDYIKELYKNVTGEWKAYGLPETVYVDNGAEFVSKSMENACWQLGVHLEYGRPGRGEDKAIIERFFGELNTMLLHELPGTSFSNLMERRDYDPMKNAVISLQDFEEILHIFLIEIMADLPSKVLGGITPREAWENGCKEFPPALPHNKEELIPLLGALETRTIRKTGIQFNELYYASAELAMLSNRIRGKNKKTTIKYNPNDISYLFVWDQQNQQYIKVLANDQGYTKGLSLWKHKIILKYLKDKMKKGVNNENLMGARQKIESIVERQWMKSKKTTTRKNLARFMDIKGKVFDAIRSDIQPLPEQKENKNRASELLGKLSKINNKHYAVLTNDPVISEDLQLNLPDLKNTVVSGKSRKNSTITKDKLEINTRLNLNC